MMADTPQCIDILEALLLVTDRPLDAPRIASVLPRVTAAQVPALIDALNQKYAETGRSFRVREIAGGYRLYTLPEYQTYVEALAVTTREARLSQAALETLAVIAYRQPVARGDIEYVRGCDCDGAGRGDDGRTGTQAGNGCGLQRPLILPCGLDDARRVYRHRSVLNARRRDLRGLHDGTGWSGR